MTNRSKNSKNSNEKMLKELEAIKKLLVLQLLNSGVQANTIAKLLKMQKSNFSTMFPLRRLKQGEKSGKKA